LDDGFLREPSSVQDEETSAALMVFFASPGAGLPSFLAPLAAGLCKVPDKPAASGSGAFSTLRGRFSISRKAAASASAARRARSRSASSTAGRGAAAGIAFLAERWFLAAGAGVVATVGTV